MEKLTVNNQMCTKVQWYVW